MTRTLLALTAGLACTAFIGAQLSPWEMNGALAGYLLAALIGIGALTWQRRTLASDPAALTTTVAVGFLLKLFGVLIGALPLRYVPALGEIADWHSFIAGYAGAALIALLVGAFDNERVIKRESLV